MHLTVATWNVWGRAEPYEQRLCAIQTELRAVAADVVGLVEVWREGDQLQIELLARELGYPHWTYVDVADGTDGAAWGVGVLSRLAIEETTELTFPNDGAAWPQSPGAASIATLRSERGTFDFVSLCEWGLGWSGYGVAAASDRLPSYRELTRVLRDHARPIAPIVVGDFNAPPESADLRALTGKDPDRGLAMSFMDTWEYLHGLPGGWTFDAIDNSHLATRPFGRHRIDYVLTGADQRFDRLWRVREVTRFGVSEAPFPPSDHYGVRAVLDLTELFRGSPHAKA